MSVKEFNLAKVIGKSILLASIQSAIGSVEMSSKFSVLNFAKDEQTLQNAADALTSYIFIAVVWALGSSAVLYGTYGLPGAICCIVANLVMILWIVLSYLHAFRKASDNFGIKYPKLFNSF
jgi:hypothetical protein